MITAFYPPFNFGGDGIFVHRLTHALARDGHEVHVIHDADAYRLLARGRASLPRSPDTPNVTVHTIQRSKHSFIELLASHQLGKPFGAHRRIRDILSSMPFDVVHFHNVS